MFFGGDGFLMWCWNISYLYSTLISLEDTLCHFLRHFLPYLLRARQAHAIIFLYTILPCMCKQPYKYTNPHYIYYVAYNHIQHYGRLAINRAHISVPIIPSKLLQLDDRLMTSPNSFEGIIETEIHAHFMTSLP